MFNIDNYDGIGLEITEREVNNPRKLHKFVTNIFLDSQGFYKDGLNIALFKEYGLEPDAPLEFIVDKLQEKMAYYKDIPWNKKIWIYFWLCTIGHDNLLETLERVYLTRDITQIAEYLKAETHPSRDRWLAIVIFLNFMDKPPRNDKFLVGMKMMQFHTKVMFYLSSKEIPKKYIVEDTLLTALTMDE
jgi:hypothetical protein